VVSGGGGTTSSFVFDDTASTFTQTTYGLINQTGPQIKYAGQIARNARGLLTLGLTASYTYNSNTGLWVATPDDPAALTSRGFALELAGQAGGFVQLPAQPVAPLVPTAQCPAIASPATYQFITIPAALTQPGVPEAVDTWNPLSETAYGRVDISTSGSTVTLANINQFTLPSAGGTGVPASPSASSVAGACGPTAYGNAISIPAPVVVTDPGSSGSNPPQAILNIGPTGLLVEDNGNTGTRITTAPSTYQNALGAGTGAVGLPRPSAALNTGTLAAAQYLGFIYGAGVVAKLGSSTGWTSYPASFGGLSSASSSCASFVAKIGTAANTATTIYGGDYDPSSSPSGFGSCDVAVDLGAQDSANPGLYPGATVYMDSTYPGNTSGAFSSFQVVAIAGQLQGKFATFLIGKDSKQPWAIYLFQSN
jgi:hypothetical protein